MAGHVGGEDGSSHIGHMSMHHLSHAETRAEVGRLSEFRGHAIELLSNPENLNIEATRENCHLLKSGLEVAKAIHDGSYNPSPGTGLMPSNASPAHSWLITIREMKGQKDRGERMTMSFEQLAKVMAKGEALADSDPKLTLSDDEVKVLMSFAEENIGTLHAITEQQLHDDEGIAVSSQRDIDRADAIEGEISQKAAQQLASQGQ